MILAIDASRANKKERTGVEWYSYFLIQEFKKIIPSGIKVRLYLREKLENDLLPLPKNWEVKILRWPFKFWTVFRLSWEMLVQKPDIFFSPANILPFFTPKGTFTTIHDIGFKRFPESYDAMERLLQNFGVKRAIKKARKVFVPSEFTKKELTEVYDISPNKLIIIPLGINLSQTPALAKTKKILEKYNIKIPYIFFVGRLAKKKNLENIIKAFKIFNSSNNPYALVLAGPKNKTITDKNIITTGWIESDDVRILMSQAELFLMPSLYEGFGLPILEAFAAGVPVITSNRSSMPEVAEGAAMLVDPKSPKEIAEAMQKIISDADLKKHLVDKGTERVKKYRWDDCAQKVFNAIKEE